MKNHFDSADPLDEMQKKLAGLGEGSIRKTYYPELQQRLEELRESEAFLKNIVDNIPAVVFVKDAVELRYVALNKVGEELLGYSREELLGRSNYELFPEEQAAYFTQKDREALSQGELLEIPEVIITTRANGARILRTKTIPLFDGKGNTRYLLGIAEDITDRKHLEEQLVQSQKMEALGRLAGGVAHDFNNMLTIIFGHIHLAFMDANLTPPLHASLEEIHKAAERSASLTQQLLAFARKQIIAPMALDLNEAVGSMLRMLQRLIGEGINLIWQPATNLWPVRMDPSQIDQILANLCINARDAISDVGKITIETENRVFDKDYCATHQGLLPGEYARLVVSDNGCGMDKGTLSKIFEPFFTTKGRGEGTGLGLATVYGIVKQNNGFINVYSEPNHGTTFTIYLPRFEGNAGQADKCDAMKEQPSSGHETILLVEDEPAILEITSRILEKLGYTVLAASTPDEAIRLAGEHAGEIHLLMTDVIMPDMNGRDLVKCIISGYPHIKHLFMSGYTANVIVHHGVLDEGVNFIQKPFSVRALASKVRNILNGK